MNSLYNERHPQRTGIAIILFLMVMGPRFGVNIRWYLLFDDRNKPDGRATSI